VRWAFPWRVADDGRELVLAIVPSAEGVWMGRDTRGRYLDRWVADDPPVPVVWREHPALSIARAGEAHAPWPLWTEGWDFRGWYVPLQSPIAPTPTGIDTMDHALDMVVEPDGAWRWKGEDGFAEAQPLGVFTPAEAARVRAEGERVVARPWPSGREDWRPWLPGPRAGAPPR
jgi:Protein of unknown function (DUF402)